MSPPAGPGQQTNPIMQFLPLILIVAVFYLFLIRPQKKRQKEREALISKMEKGDKVVTSSGIHGTVSQVEDTTILVQVAENTKMRFEKSAVTNVTSKNAS
ncbi:MAG: preprotein translocase subunit YajC [Bacteroidota bacterium]|nr:preprotein translocase subunit YajC [Bacteroidota bacterium]MDP4234396.1 preprotein translocase subunit YajC [Bacteroidota bacterium]